MAMTIIKNAEELTSYQKEWELAQAERALWSNLSKTADAVHKASAEEDSPRGVAEGGIETPLLADEASLLDHQGDSELSTDIKALSEAITAYHKKEASQKRLTAEKINGEAVSPLMQLWMVLFGAGIMVKETVKVATATLDKFLFPVHFFVDGVRSIFDLYRLYRDKTEPYRKTKLGAAAVNVVGLTAAATVLALAITNPFALPVTFLGLTAAGLYKDAYALRQTSKSIKAIQTEQQTIGGKIDELNRLASKDKLEQVRFDRLTAKHARLEAQLVGLKTERRELKRSLFFHVLSVIAVGLLITGAVALLAFPPAAAALASAGLLMFAGAAVANVMTSPPVVGKVQRAINWLKNCVSGEKTSREAGYQVLPGQDNAPKVKVANDKASQVSKKTGPSISSTPANFLGYKQSSNDNYGELRANAAAMANSGSQADVVNPLTRSFSP